MAVELRYGVSAFAGGEQGILADQMAASLLNLTGQNFQTTRDHIANLTTLGLPERQPGSRCASLSRTRRPLNSTSTGGGGRCLVGDRSQSCRSHAGTGR